MVSSSKIGIGVDALDGLEMIPDYHSTELTQVRLWLRRVSC